MLNSELIVYQRDIEVLSPAAAKDFIFTIRHRLLAIGMQFRFSDKWADVTLTEQLFTETLMREKFWQGADRLRRGLQCVRWTFDEKLPDPPTGPVS